eukprot:CAMPEP_0198146240 /NCGR_PEP_ID=MMETSP1443-20131203/28301_1 /TAXON_ID=186043 /ORGANISM="Entomoneis sp., Strain CCMP2396" /LENGTH=269 /DNA_ID=CAMNT_0043810129 /DNA_START=161 /DNA_END=970 /DNA_ORIENTATION=-
MASAAGPHDNAIKDDRTRSITIIGFGSLLSETSSRMTFPALTNFRLARVPGYRRVFGHPASIFFQRKIANMETLEISSLSVEYVSNDYPGFVAAIFEVPNDNYILNTNNDGNDNSAGEESSAVVPSQKYLEREEEFNFAQVPFVELNDGSGGVSHELAEESSKTGIICTKSTDQTYLERWGQDHFENFYGVYGVKTIWHWPHDSGMRPCAVYLRHCYLAAKKMGPTCFNSFLDETFLIDRVTTVRAYVEKYPQVLDTQPPPELVIRYSG